MYSSAAALSQQQEKTRSHLNMIDFFDPDLADAAAASRPKHNYTLKYGVSGYAKAGKVVEYPQDDDIYTSTQVGDDAYFLRSDSLGVSDGVGGWRTHTGANPALYSRKLMHYAQLELDRIKSNVRPQHVPQHIANPVEIMENAYHLTTLDAQNEVSPITIKEKGGWGIVGSTTACIVVLCQDELRVANLGDCGISVIRQNNYIFRSEEQQHSFNFPYQLGTASFDSPMDAQQFTIKVEEGDIMILASDGLFDNLYDDEIMEEVQQCIEKDPSLPLSDTTTQAISEALAFRAKVGGKADDITLIVAVINRDDQQNPGPSPPPLP
ncbi:phosphatase 2C-like domain-containing protein [Absidia repens]|uniref:Protein phosphatase n=1 Tax=Absidia repens TaxID=90262 RepID=A0A1X2IK33_9FUNG|nr:phosphatase 2C-like domain-containing protein [Absidia repens]